MSLLTQNTVANDSVFKVRVQMAIVAAAIAIQGEDENNVFVPPGFPPTSPAGGEAQHLHNLRANLAYAVLNNSEAHINHFAVGAAADETISDAFLAGTLSDTDLSDRISAIWSAFATQFTI